MIIIKMIYRNLIKIINNHHFLYFLCLNMIRNLNQNILYIKNKNGKIKLRNINNNKY